MMTKDTLCKHKQKKIGVAILSHKVTSEQGILPMFKRKLDNNKWVNSPRRPNNSKHVHA